MRDVLILLVVFSMIPMIFLRPHVGILAWYWISCMNPHRLSWSFAYDFPVAMVIGAATLLAWVLSKEPKKLPLNAVSVLLLTFVFWMSFANLFAMVPDLAFEKWNQSIKILLMTFATMALMQSRERLHALIWVVVSSLAFFGIKGGLFTILSGGVAHVWGPSGSFIADNNALAMALVMVLPWVRYLQLHTDSKPIRFGLYATMALMVFSIIGSQSRGAFLGGITMLAFLLVKSRQRVLLGMIVAVLLTVGAIFVPSAWVDRMKTIETYQQDGSALGRLEVWGFAIKIARDRPIVGGGFRVSYDDEIYLRYVPNAISGHGRNFHSVYFEVLGELGYVGLFTYLALLLAVWKSGSRVIAVAKTRPDLRWASDLAHMTQVSLVGFVVAGAFQNLAFFDLYFFLVAVLFVSYRIVLRQLEVRDTVLEPQPVQPTAKSRPRLPRSV